MDIFNIFDNNNQGLYTITYDNTEQPELIRLFDFWQNPGDLVNYFTSNEEQLKGYYHKYSLKGAVQRTVDDATKLKSELLFSYETDQKYLDNFFSPLHELYTKPNDLESQKAYGCFYKSWLRLYALKFGSNYYLITGGGIKLTRSMDDDELLIKEKEKINRCRLFCKEEGIIDIEGLQTYR